MYTITVSEKGHTNGTQTYKYFQRGQNSKGLLAHLQYHTAIPYLFVLEENKVIISPSPHKVVPWSENSLVINISRIRIYMLEVLINTDLSSLFLKIYRERYQNVFTLHHNAKGTRWIQTALYWPQENSRDYSLRIKKAS